MTEQQQKTIESINKDLGKGSAMLLSEKPEQIEVVSTGSLGLDIVLGVGGLPTGRIVEIYGPESSGKTTIAMHVIAEAQKKGIGCAIVDAEHAFSLKYARQVGVDVDNLVISQPDYGEQALEIADRFVNGGFGVVIIDSVAALVPKAELEGEMGDSKMGAQARLMSQAMRKMTASVSKNNCILIFINQLREKIGVMFGNPEVTTGGNALKFYASIRLDVRRSVTAANSVMNGEEKIGNLTTVKVIKNKVAPPFKSTEFDILYGYGIDAIGQLIDLAVESKIMEKAGSWFSFEGNKLGQGRDAVKQILIDNPDLTDKIKKLTWEASLQ